MTHIAPLRTLAGLAVPRDRHRPGPWPHRPEQYVPLTRVSAEPFTNAPASTRRRSSPTRSPPARPSSPPIQVGRFFDGGATDIGYARSTDGGATWDVSSFLPGLTFNAGRSRTPTVRLSASATRAWPTTPAHGMWMISSIPLLPSLSRADGLRQPLDQRRRDIRRARCRSRRPRPRRSTSTRTGPSATTTRPARSTATATRSSTTSARATSST